MTSFSLIFPVINIHGPDRDLEGSHRADIKLIESSLAPASRREKLGAEDHNATVSISFIVTILPLLMVMTMVRCIYMGDLYCLECHDGVKSNKGIAGQSPFRGSCGRLH